MKRIKFGCGHEKVLPEKVVYRSIWNRGAKYFYKMCKECREKKPPKQDISQLGGAS